MDWAGELTRCAELNKLWREEKQHKKNNGKPHELLAHSYFKYQIGLSTNWFRSKNAKKVTWRTDLFVVFQRRKSKQSEVFHERQLNIYETLLWPRDSALAEFHMTLI